MDKNDNNRESTPRDPQQETPRKRTAPPTNTGAPRKRPVQSTQAAKRPAAGEKRPARRPAPAQPRQQERPRKEPQNTAPQEENPGVEEEVYRPKPDTRRRPASENPPVREPRRSAPAKKTKAKEKGETGYQPYKAANQRKKAQKASNLKTFFSGNNPLLKKMGGGNRDAFAEDSDLARKRREQRAADAARKKKKQSPFSAPAVIYTDPTPFNRDRLLVQLLTIVAVVLAFVLGLSVFFKVKVIKVSGANVYNPWTIQEASGIKEGDNLLTFGRARASGQITANLPYVKSVRIGIKLPDTVNIEIEEENVVYAIKSNQDIWWLMSSDGKVVAMSNNNQAKSYTQIVGVTLADPEIGVTGIATEAAPVESVAEGEYVPVLVTGAQRLTAALQIIRALEDNDIVGDVASVDVSHLDDIIMWYGTRYQVNLGDDSQLDNKIAFMYDAILQMSDYQTGVLDVSFTIWPDQIGYTPFQ